LWNTTHPRAKTYANAMRAGVLRETCGEASAAVHTHPKIVKQFGVTRHPCRHRSADQLDSAKPRRVMCLGNSPSGGQRMEYRDQCLNVFVVKHIGIITSVILGAIVGMFSIRPAESTAIGESVLPWNCWCWNSRLRLGESPNRSRLGGDQSPGGHSIGVKITV